MRLSTSDAGTTPPSEPAAAALSVHPQDRVDGRDARWEAHRSSRRTALVKAARRAVHHRGPDLSMDEIATEMGTSKSIIYRYFTDKSGLQAAVGGAVIDDLRVAIAEATRDVTRPREQIAAMIDVYLGFVETSAHVYAFVTQSEATATAGAVRGFIAETEDIVAQSLLLVLGPPDVTDDSAQALAALWAAGVVGLARAGVERWVAARGSRAETGLRSEAGEGAEPLAVEHLIGALDRPALAAHLTDWVWEGATGVARRVRATARRPDETSLPDDGDH